MRKRFRTRRAVSVEGGAAFVAWIAACSGSSSQDVVAPTHTDPEASVPDTSKPDVQNDVILDVVKDTGPIYDAGPANVLDSGDEGGVPCVVGGQLVDEPDDDKASASELAPTRCGVIQATGDAGADGGIDRDFLTFTLPATTNTFYLQFAGNVSLKVEVEGNPPVTITPTSSPPVPFVKGKPYFIEVRSLDGKRQNYRVTVFQS